MKRLRCVVFASSLKHGGRCIVAKDFDSKKWFRFVSDEKGRLCQI